MEFRGLLFLQELAYLILFLPFLFVRFLNVLGMFWVACIGRPRSTRGQVAILVGSSSTTHSGPMSM